MGENVLKEAQPGDAALPEASEVGPGGKQES